MALAASLQEELAALCQWVDSQEQSASQHEVDEAEDKDKHPAVRCRLRSFRRFVTDTLPDYVPQLDPSGHAPCSIALASLDRFFEQERRSRAIDVQVESALLLSPLLLGVQSYLDRRLQGRREEDPIYDFSESLAAFKRSQVGAQLPSRPAENLDSDTKTQLRTLSLGHEELFGGKLDEASKQAEERGRCQRDLKV